MKNALSSLINRIDKNKKLSEALESNKKLFGDYFCIMVSAGEISGSTGAMLLRLADYYETNTAFRRKVLGKTVPGLLFVCTALCTVFAALAYIVPGILEKTMEYRHEISTTTAAAIALVSFVFSHIGAIILFCCAFVAAAIAFFLVFHRIVFLEKMVWCMPLLGNLVRKNSLRVFFLALSTILYSGVTLILSIRHAANQSGSSIIRATAATIEPSMIETAASVVHLLESKKIISPAIKEMLKDAKSVSEVESLLRKTAFFYEESIIASISAAAIIIEPVIVALAGLAALGLLIALYLPFIHFV